MLNIERIEAVIKEQGYTFASLEKAVGFGNGTMSRWGKNSPSVDKLLKLANFLEVTASSLLNEAPSHLEDDEAQLIKYFKQLPEKEKGRALGSIETRAEIYSQNNVEPKQKEATPPQSTKPKEKPPTKLTLHNKEFAENEYINMLIYDQPAAAGLGNYLSEYSHHEEISVLADTVPFKADFGIRIAGDSMTPKIKDKEIVWVEARPQIENGQIGIFILNGEAYCKKLNIEYLTQGRAVSLVSLNPKYEPIEIHKKDNLQTVGLVLL